MVGSGNNPNQVFPLPSTVFDPSSFGRLQPPIYSPPVPVSLVTNHHTEQGVHLFFANAAHVFPFLHQPTFDSSSVPEPLLMGVLSLGLLYMEDEEHGSRLAKACFHRGRELLETDHLQNKIASGLELHAIQACLLLEMHAVMSTCGFETAYGLRIHTRAIEVRQSHARMIDDADSIVGEDWWISRTAPCRFQRFRPGYPLAPIRPSRIA